MFTAPAISGGDPAITNRIAGNVTNFGFVAQEIGSLKLAGRALTFQSGASNDILAQLIGTTGTLRAVESA